MANYTVDILVALKGAQKLDKFQQGVKKTNEVVDLLNKNTKLLAKNNKLVVVSFDNLNKTLNTAKASFNAVALGTQLQIKTARQLVAAERLVNKEYKQREALLQRLRGTGPMPLPGSGVGSDPVAKSIARRRRKLSRGANQYSGPIGPGQAVSANLSSRLPSRSDVILSSPLPPRSAINPAYTGPVGPGQAQSLFAGGTFRNNLMSNINMSRAGREASNFGFGSSGDPTAKAIRRNKEKQFKDFLKEKKANKEIRNIKAGQLKLERAQNRALKERVVTTRTLAKTTKTTGGGMSGGQGIFRGGARGALSNAMIGGGFPLLFGQGALGAAGGGIGGALGGAIGGGFGFSLSIIGTAIAQRIQEAIDFRKEIEKVNITIEKTGGNSKITATDITALSKSLKITKDEALQAANAFAAFGAQSSLALAETFKDRSSFNLYANINKDAKTFIGTVDTLFQKNELGIKQAKESLKILEEKGLKEAVIYAEAIKNEEKIRKEIDAIKPSEEDKRKADAMFLTYFNPQTAAPLKSFIDLNEEAQKSILKLTTNEGQLEERLGTVEERFKKRLDLVKQNIEAQREFNETVERQLIIQAPKDELEKLLDPLLQVDALGKSIGASFSESFKGIVKGSMSAQDALRNLFQRTADHFLDMAAQMLAAQIRSSIFGLFGNAFTGGLGGGGGNTTPTLTPDQQVSRFTYGRADGGSVKGGNSYIVGERGPELFSPGVSGMITPNESLGGGTNIVVNVDASGSNVEGDEDEGRALGVALSAAIETELIKQKRPGGLLA